MIFLGLFVFVESSFLYFGGVFNKTIIPLALVEDIARWREDMNFIFEWQNNILRTSAASKILFLSRENKIHIFKPQCNVLFII